MSTPLAGIPEPDWLSWPATAKAFIVAQQQEIEAGQRLEQLVCDSKILRGSAVETEGGGHRFVAQVTAYARGMGVALAQKAYDDHECSERADLEALMSKL